MKSVVIVDDNPGWIENLSTEVNNNPNFKVVATATSGREGKLMIEHYKPDVVIMDIIMPDDDGLKVIKHIREECTGYQPYLYIITAVNTSSMRQMLKDLGIDFVGFKPIKAEKINETLNLISSYETRVVKNNVPRKAKRDIADIIDDTLVKIGVPTHLSGFLCIKTALYFIIDNPNARRQVYTTVSSILNVSRGNVDKNIRTAIDACMGTDLYLTLFGKFKASNLTFLHNLALYIEKQLRGSEQE